jgi:hypothetical protein
MGGTSLSGCSVLELTSTPVWPLWSDGVERGCEPPAPGTLLGPEGSGPSVLRESPFSLLPRRP